MSNYTQIPLYIIIRQFSRGKNKSVDLIVQPIWVKMDFLQECQPPEDIPPARRILPPFLVRLFDLAFFVGPEIIRILPFGITFALAPLRKTTIDPGLRFVGILLLLRNILLS